MLLTAVYPELEAIYRLGSVFRSNPGSICPEANLFIKIIELTLALTLLTRLVRSVTSSDLFWDYPHCGAESARCSAAQRQPWRGGAFTLSGRAGLGQCILHSALLDGKIYFPGPFGNYLKIKFRI